jgi:hypothetical protein
MIEVYQVWIQIILILPCRLLLVCQLVYLLLNLCCDVLSLALDILVLTATTGSKPLVSIAAWLIIWSLLIYEAIYDA